MTMMKKMTSLVVAMTFCLYVTSVKSDTCALMDQLRTCFPNMTRYMERPMNVSIVVLALGSSSGMPAIEARCLMFNKLTDCMTKGLASCDKPYSDAGEAGARYWENVREAVDFMCNQHKAEFIESQSCMSGSALRNEATACGVHHDDHRRKRHTCSDYEREVKCVDGVVTKHCGSDVANRAGRVMRNFLKNSPTTLDCKAPAFSSADGLRSPSGVLAALSMTSFVVAMLAMF